MRETSSTFGSRISYDDGAIALSEILSALTFALDLTEGAVPGHTLRTCLLGMRIAGELGIPDELRKELYYALLLKDVGCSSNAARLCVIVGGDERAVKAGSKLGDWKDPKMMRMLWQNVLPDGNATQRIKRILKMGADREKNNTELFQLRCDRGAQILRKLQMGNLAAEAVYHLDEFWDGSGYPEHIQGESIPLLSRICSIAQNLDVFASEKGTDTAIKVLRQRRGTWFDPKLVDLVRKMHRGGQLWKYCGPDDDVEITRAAVIGIDEGERTALAAERIDSICEAFASVVDAKSPFTYRHSIGVAETSTAIATELGLPNERLHLVRRAALLHDVGKLRVSNSILDKNGKPTEEEWDIIREHPALTHRILKRVGAFREMAIVAAEHHERLDGSGYPYRLQGEHMSVEARIISLADVFTALAEKRPYRDSIEPQKVLGMLERDIPNKLDSTCYEALTTLIKRDHWALPNEVTQADDCGCDANTSGMCIPQPPGTFWLEETASV